MDYLQEIQAYRPQSKQEDADREAILQHCALEGDRILLRESRLAHLCASGMIFNPARDKVLLCHHNILGTWAWTGGHMDGERDILSVSLREAVEETGVREIRPISEALASLDVLFVKGHMKRGAYVSTHLHLSASYLLECPEDTVLHARPGENTGVSWFPLDWITTENLPEHDVYLYKKLIQRAHIWG